MLSSAWSQTLKVNWACWKCTHQSLDFIAFQTGVFMITLRNSYLYVMFLTLVPLSGLLHKEHPWLTWRACKSENYLCINTWTTPSEPHALCHGGWAIWLLHWSHEANVFLNIIEMPFFFTHLEIQTMPYCCTFLVQKDALLNLCISWLIDSYLLMKEKTT